MLSGEQATVAEDVVIAVELAPPKAVLEIVGHVDEALVYGRVAREVQLLALDEHRRVGQPLEAAGVVEVQVRHDHEVDVARREADPPQARLDVILRPDPRVERGRRRTEPGLRIDAHLRMDPGVEQHRPLRVGDHVHEVRVV